METRRAGLFVAAIAAVVVGVLYSPASAAGRAVRLTLRSGAQRTVVLEGVGCSISMCSREAVKSRSEGDTSAHRTRLDAIASISDITPRDALFAFKDGTARRLSVTEGNRVFYMATRTGEEKIDLAQLASLEFVSAK